MSREVARRVARLERSERGQVGVLVVPRLVGESEDHALTRYRRERRLSQATFDRLVTHRLLVMITEYGTRPASSGEG